MGKTSDRAVSPPVPTPGSIPSKRPFPMVGIGASAGGLVSIRSLPEHMPAANGMAFATDMCIDRHGILSAFLSCFGDR